MEAQYHTSKLPRGYPEPAAASERIDVQNFGEVVNRVFALLDACACQIREYQQAKWEMEREYAP